MNEEYLTHKEIALDLKEIKAKLEDLQNQINKNKHQFLGHIDRNDTNLE